MTDRKQRQPAIDQAPHTIPEDAPVLAAPRQSAMPEPSHLESSKKSQHRVVHGHFVIADMPTYHRLQPLALFGNEVVPTTLKLGFHLVQLRLQPFAHRLPQHREPSIALLLHADMRKAKKVERLRFPFSTPLSASLNFPMRPKATGARGGLGISRFPHEVSPYVLGVSDRAGLWCTPRYRCTRWGFPHSPTASASRSKSLTRLNTRSVRFPCFDATLASGSA
jgi:hypothetical protein